MSPARVPLLLLLLFWGRSSSGAYTKLCYTRPRAHLYDAPFLLPDVSRDVYPGPRAGRGIFFHETSCAAHVALTARQACAVESAARHNPRRHVYVLFAAPRATNGTEDRYARVLAALANVRLCNADLWEYARATLAEAWVASDALFNAADIEALLGEFLRLLTLAKYQGTYLALDTLSLQPLPPVHNSAALESGQALGSGLISLDETRSGHILGEYLLRHFLRSVQRDPGQATAQRTLTAVARDLCRVKQFDPRRNVTCNGFSVLPQGTAYAVSPAQFHALFEAAAAPEVLQRLQQSTVVRLWQQYSAHVNVTKGSGSALDLLAKTHCPGVYNVTRKVF